MASGRALYIAPPVHYNPAIQLDTQEKLREGVEAVARALITQGAEPFEDGEHRWFAWVASPTFNGYSKGDLLIVDTCLRMESVFLAYTLAIWTINGSHNKLQKIVRERRERGRQAEIVVDSEELHELCNQIYLAYLVLVDQCKGNLIMWNQRTHPYRCAEHYANTCNVLINICAALHTVAFIEYAQQMKSKLTKSSWARLFLFIALRFERAYFILTDFVWVMYGGSHITAVNLQRVCLGFVLYYRAKAYMISIQSLGDSTSKHTRSLGTKYTESEIALAFAQRSIYLLRPLVDNPFFGFQDRARNLLDHSEQIVRERFLAAPDTSFVRKRVETAEDYDKLGRVVDTCLSDAQAKHMLRVHAETGGRSVYHYQPDLRYGNYDAFLHHALSMPEV